MRQSALRAPFRDGLGLISCVLILGVCRAWTQQSTLPSPPETRVDNVKEVIHGVEVVDHYRWLEDQQSPETRAWIDAQNKYTQSLLSSWVGREKVKQRLGELMKIENINMPIERHGRYFYQKRLPTQDQFVIYMRKSAGAPEEVLIDPNPMSPDHSTSVDLMEASEDGTLIAYGLRQGGEDEVTPTWLDVDARRELPDRLPKGRYFTVSIKPDKSGFYYSRQEAEGPRVYYHAMGTDAAEDILAFGKGHGPDKLIGASLSEDGRYLTVEVDHGSAADVTEIYYQDLVAKRPLRPLVNDIPARFFSEVGGDHLFLHTNWKAPKGRILAVDLKEPDRDHWREVVPEGSAVIGSLTLAGGKLLVNYTENAVSRVRVYDAEGKHLRDLQLPALGSASVSGHWEGRDAFYDFTSFPVPLRIYRYDVENGNEHLWAQLRVPIQSDQFAVEQVWYQSKDGTLVPMFLVHRKGIKLDSTRPTLLTGYGGFNISETPYFSSMGALWVENGGVFAVANLRGGGEFGEAWHKAGMLGNKQNVFDDFISAADWLIKNRYTNPSHLAIEGTSNGGLLVGAALTQRPDLFGAVACGFPLLDMLRYQKFLVARFWVSEYGSSDDPVQFKTLLAYSPYQHVKPGTKYPAVILFSGDSDTRVAPLHARKMAALLQTDTASGKPVVLRYDTEAGHSRGLPVTKQIDEYGDVLGFLFWQLGLPFPNPSP